MWITVIVLRGFVAWLTWSVSSIMPNFLAVMMGFVAIGYAISGELADGGYFAVLAGGMAAIAFVRDRRSPP